MVLDPQLCKQLEDQRLGVLIPRLQELGVESAEDLAFVEEKDLDTEIQRRRFAKFRRELRQEGQTVEECTPVPTPPDPAPDPEPLPAPEPAPAQAQAFTWAVAALAADLAPPVAPQASQTPPEPRFACFRRKAVPVPRLRVLAGGIVELLSREGEMFRLREGQLGHGSDEGWAWVHAHFPCAKDSCDDLRSAVEAAQQGLQWEGRRYYLASTSKSEFGKGGTAWLASPPEGAGPERLEEALGWGRRFTLQAPSQKRPHPEFLLRARVKQLFSPIVVSMQSHHLDISVVPDVCDASGLERTDGAGELDPDIVEALAAFWLPQYSLEDDGQVSLTHEDLSVCRYVPGSAQVRSGGLKGMLQAVERLRGTGKIEVPKSMSKFDDLCDFGPELGVISFSKVRPTSIGLDLILRLQARGAKASLFIERQREYLRKIGGTITRQRAHRMLRADDLDEDGDSGSYLSTFARLFKSGYDLHQQPLLTVLNERQRSLLEKARRAVPFPGVWSLRGVPEPKPPDGEEYVLHGEQVFARVPEHDSSGWRTVVGRALIDSSKERDPWALRLVEAVDNERLTRKCLPGLLYFSVQGAAVQRGLSWDFDGDYYHLIEHSGIALSELDRAPGEYEFPASRVPPALFASGAPSLGEVMGEFLCTFPEHDQIGLAHFKWQALAGEGPRAAATPEARQMAALYALALDVEKGGRRQALPRRNKWLKRWDFMKSQAHGQTSPSPTAAGEVFRMASKALSDFELQAQGVSSGQDVDLTKQWAERQARFSNQDLGCLYDIAKRKRSQLVEYVLANCQRARLDSSNENLDTHSLMSERGSLWQKFLEDLRSEAVREAAEGGVRASLKDLALAAWHLKYVKQRVAFKDESGDKTFPWVLFCDELCELKEEVTPCCRAAMDRLRRLLLAVRATAATRAEDDSGRAEQQFSKSLQRLRSFKVGCEQCSLDVQSQKQLQFLYGPDVHPAAERVTEAFRAVAQGETQLIPVSQLYYAKEKIGRFFRHGKQTGEPLETLVLRLVNSEVHGLEVSAVKYHGRFFVVEGNRRLWCLKEAGRRADREFKVKVRVANLYLGRVRQQEERSPAFHTFWHKFTTTTFGETVTYREEPP